MGHHSSIQYAINQFLYITLNYTVYMYTIDCLCNIWNNQQTTVSQIAIYEIFHVVNLTKSNIY